MTGPFRRRRLIDLAGLRLRFATCLILTLCALPSSAERWVQVGAFPRYVLHVDLDAVTWHGDDEAEVRQRTVLTEAGRAFFVEGYRKSGRKEEPPAEVIALERYFRDRRHRTVTVSFLNSRGDVTFQARDVPYPQDIDPGSPYEAVWEHLFLTERPRHRATRRADCCLARCHLSPPLSAAGGSP